MRLVLIVVSAATSHCLSGWSWRCRGGVLSRGGETDRFRRSNSRCPLLPSASVVLLPSGGDPSYTYVAFTTATRLCTTAHVARNELAAKHACFPYR